MQKNTGTKTIANQKTALRLILLAVLFILARIAQNLFLGGNKGIPLLYISGSLYIVALLSTPLNSWWKIVIGQLVLQLPFLFYQDFNGALAFLSGPTLGPILVAWIYLKLNKGIYAVGNLTEFRNLILAFLAGSTLAILLILPFRAESLTSVLILNTIFAPVGGGIIICYLFSPKAPVKSQNPKLYERLSFFFAAPLLAYAIYIHPWIESYHIEFHYLLFPFFFLMAIRLSRLETMLALLLTILIVASNSTHELNDPSILEKASMVFSLQLLILVISIGTIIISINKESDTKIRTESQENEKLYRTLIDSLPQRVYLKDMNSIYRSVNKTFLTGLNLAEKDILGKKDADIFPEEIAKKYLEDDKLVLSRNKTIDFERKLQIQGIEQYVHTVKTPFIGLDGRKVGILGISWDVTENLKTQEKLHQSETRYRTIFHSSPVGLALANAEGTVLDVNDSLSVSLGYSPGELKNISITNLLPYQLSWDRILHDLQTGSVMEYGDMLIKSKHKKNIQCILSFTRFELHENSFILSSFQDISQQKEIENSLRKSEKRLGEAELIAHAGNFEINLDTLEIFWSAGQYFLYGLACEPASITYDRWCACLHPDEQNALELIIKEARTGEIDEKKEFRILRTEGIIRHILWKAKLICTEDNTRLLVGVNLDITELREAENKIKHLNEELEERVKLRTTELEAALLMLREREKALRNSEEQFRALMEQSPLAISIYTTNGVLQQVNPAWKKLWGVHHADTLTGNFMLFENYSFAGITRDAFNEVLMGKEFLLPEFLYEKASPMGHSIKRIIRSYIYPIHNQAGKITSVVIANEDITRQRQIVEVLRSLLRMTQNASKQTGTDIIRSGLDEALRLSNSQAGYFQSFAGKNPILPHDFKTLGAFKLNQSGDGKSPFPIVQPDVHDQPIYRRSMPARVEDELAQVNTSTNRKGDHVFRELVVPVFDQGKLMAILGVSNKPEDYDEFDQEQVSFFAQQIWNIIQASEADDALRKSKELYRTLVETIPEAVITLDKNGIIQYASSRAAEFAGMDTPSRLTGRPLSDFIEQNELRNLAHCLADVYEKSEFGTIQCRMIKPDGSLLPVEISALLLDIQPGDAAEVIVTARDISDRINAETALRESEERYKKFFSDNHAIMLLVHPETGMIVDANPAACEFYGYTEAELTSKNVRDISIASAEEEEQRMEQTRSQLKNHYFSRHQLGWEEVRDVDVYSGLIIINNMELIYMIVHDDSERKKGEEQLRSLAKAQTVLLREVNHRVKNNLAALISMLHIEEDRAEAAGISNYSGLLRDLVSRIKGLSTVHSLLSARNWQPLELSHLVEKIMQACTEGLPSNKTVVLHIEPSQIMIGSNQAHHLAMVINEIATNSVKHTLTHWDETSIRFSCMEKDECLYLDFSDDGPGFPEEFIRNDFTASHVGFELIRGIVMHSLNGKLRLWNDKGAHLRIEFQSELK